MDSWYLRNKEYASAKQKEYKSTPEFKLHRLEKDRKNKDHNEVHGRKLRGIQ